MTCIVMVELCGALRFSSMISLCLAGEKKISLQDIRLRPAVHKPRVSTFIWC